MIPSLSSAFGPVAWAVATPILAMVCVSGRVEPDHAMPLQLQLGGPGSVGARSVQRAAADIDRLIEARLRDAGQRPAAVVDDETFVRRAWLEIAGRIPTVVEREEFLSNTSRTKRTALIERLLASAGHQSRMFHFWADLLRLKNRMGGQISGEPYIHFVKQSLADNTPYDRFVHDLVAAEGPALARDNGATGYILRDRGMPEDHAANTMRLFLGTRMECAQCHNHPFDKWTQQDFMRLVAFEGGVRYVHTEDAQVREVMALGRKLRNQDPQAYRAYRLLARGANAGVSGGGTGLTRLPKDYGYDDAQPNQVVVAKVPFGELNGAVADPRDAAALGVRVPSEPPRRQRQRPNRRGRSQDRFADVDSRQAFAAWLTSADNERFTTVIANRMWRHVMGLGLIEPVDDLRDDSVASHPDVLLLLRQVLVEYDFDLQRFLAVLYSTRTWQRPAQAENGDEPLFAGPLLRRMSAEQVWDSLLTLVVEDVDDTLSSPADGAEEIYARYEDVLSMSPTELLAEVEQRAERFRDPEGFRERMAEQRAAMRKDRQASSQRLRALRRELALARRKGQSDEARKLQEQIDVLRAEMGPQPRANGRRGRPAMVRASELPTPAPAGHFVRRFGQSDREQIGTSIEEANVPQVLGLLNGVVEEHVLDKDSELAQDLRALQQPDSRVTLAFVSILGREPTRREAATWGADLRRDLDGATRDLVWVLLNTHEFLFVR